MGSRTSSSAGETGASNPTTSSSSSSSSSSARPRAGEDDDDVDLAQVLAYLLRSSLHRGQVRLVHGRGATGLQLVQSYSDSDDDNDSAWSGRHGDRYNPPVDQNPDTKDIDISEIKAQIQLATGSLGSSPNRCIARLLRQREQGLCRNTGFSHGECSRVASHFLPNHVAYIDTYTQKAFCGIYSKDGSIFMSACQDQHIRLYNTRNGKFHKFKTIKARDVGWSVLDVAFTPDGTHLLYSSWSDYIHICNIYEHGCGDCETHKALDFNPDNRRFCVFSLTVSSDGREILGGTNTMSMYHHTSNFLLKNSSWFKNKTVKSILFRTDKFSFKRWSDVVCPIWETLTLPVPDSRSTDTEPAIFLQNHLLSTVLSRGDARYLISNSKDQTVKLWDIRKFSPREGLEASRQAVTQQNWDYRWQQVPKRALKKHKLQGDTSVMTYRGHGVLHTLIRCRFSPEFTTGQQYIYSGCSTGKVVAYGAYRVHFRNLLVEWQRRVRASSFKKAKKKLIFAQWDGGLRLWDYCQGEYFEDDLIDSKQRQMETGEMAKMKVLAKAPQ
uniref:DDB1 and CUL4 associated factor 11 n=1 Tax=Latimeria chalumnae TaxID=7897 RepID=H3AN30_LATCH